MTIHDSSGGDEDSQGGGDRDRGQSESSGEASHRGDVNQNNDFYVLMRDKIENAVNEALAAIDYHRYNGKESRLIHSLCLETIM
ncbi:unnamed protein product [Adineta steineri]|uniref:Uncharacterized protein n=1 Tax=Adineta steineri TaxID=433720 RepID=A0A814LVG2_9BILA|nr:unnamed protein product [Adineta steineri]CAF4080149.1 unnamed protein product [Adineta steineri]